MAVRTAGENAALNGVADKLTVLVGDLSDKASGKYDIITANIVANAIMSLAPAVPGLMADDAVFIASGIIDSRKDEVIAALEAAGLAVLEVKEKRGWECIVCKKHKATLSQLRTASSPIEGSLRCKGSKNMPHRYFTTEISDGTAVLRGGRRPPSLPRDAGQTGGTPSSSATAAPSSILPPSPLRR